MAEIKESNQVKITLAPETVAFLQAEYPNEGLLEIFWQLLAEKHPNAPLKRPKRGFALQAERKQNQKLVK